MKDLLAKWSLIIIFVLGLARGELLSQNLLVNSSAPYNNPMWLVQNVLVGSGIFVFSPLNSSGVPINQPNSVQIGKFSNLNPAFGLDSGIVMVTTNTNDVVPGQNGSYTTYPSQTPSANLGSVLNAIGSTSSNLYDRATIQFSFVPNSDSISFDYVFGSKEYTSYTCSSFNDVFGFFLIGPGINGAPMYLPNGSLNIDTVNLATIPGTSIPVAINTVNQGFPSGGNPAANCLNANPNYVAHSVYYNANTGGTSVVNLEGYTDVLTAKASVYCGAIYTIKLMIADVSDGALNSAVFIGSSGSFGKVPELKMDLMYYSSDSTLYEGCEVATLVFTRIGSNVDTCVIPLSYSGDAVQGIDYSVLPSSLTLFPGQSSDTISIVALPDAIIEGIEYLKVVRQPVASDCAVYPADSVLVKIDDRFSQHLSYNILNLSNLTFLTQFDTLQYTVNFKDYDSINWGISSGILLSSVSSDTVNVVWSDTDTVVQIDAYMFKGGCTDTLSYQDYVSLLGMHEIETGIRIYPIPSSSTFYIETNDDLMGSKIFITNSVGEVVLSKDLRANTVEVDLSSCSRGTYYISFANKEGKLIQKLLLIK